MEIVILNNKNFKIFKHFVRVYNLKGSWSCKPKDLTNSYPVISVEKGTTRIERRRSKQYCSHATEISLYEFMKKNFNINIKKEYW